MKKIAVLTSGGDAPGMNPCIRAVVRTAGYYGIEAYGVNYGYQGMIDNDIIRLQSRDVRFIIDKGGTMLYSARCKQFHEHEFRKKAFENLKAHGIEGLVAIGGDGTFTGAQIFSSEYDIPVIGIPGTIDNDIAGTDVTLGYDTASNTAMEAIDKIRDTSTSHNRLFLVEVMGRDAGDIALRCGLAVGAIATFIPEKKGEFDQLVKSLERAKARKKRANIIVVAEGEETGGAIKLSEMINERFPEYETRVSILGHMQRGGSPTVFDRELAARMGVKAVEALKAGERNQMVAMVNNTLQLVPLEKAVTERAEVNPEKIRMLEILSR
ncbi:MAG: 6-phosphofructokinase [Bacteroidetes bacterium]|nr:6-phosphofructokinase [Bacteroidota bacterium]